MKSLIKIIEKLASVLFLSMCVMVFVQVLMRYAFNKPIYWAEEFSLSVFTWVAFIGAALALRKSRHARITLLIDKFPEAIRQKVELGGQGLVALISVLIFYQSVKYNGLARTITLPALNVPQSFVSFAITFSAVLMFIFSIEAIFNMIRKKDREAGLETKS